MVGGMAMKKGLILLAALLIVASFTVSGHAQSLFNIWPGGMPAFGGGPGACGPLGPRLFEPPTFYVGWMESLRRVSWSFADPNPGGLFGGKHNWDVAGLWLGLEQKINLTETCGVDLDGWVLIPSNRQGAELEAGLTTQNVGSVAPVIITIPVPGGRTWNTRSEWWYLDAAATCAFCTPLKALAGFRYEHFSVRFDNPSDINGIASSADSTADLTINSYLPFVGLQTSVGGPASNVCVRFIGFPWAPANVTHSETGLPLAGSRIDSTGNWNRSYFWEIFAEYNRSVAANMGIGAFFRWNVLHGQTNLDATLPAGTISSDSAFDRNTMTFGGSFSLNFGSPL
jgi:hypothetical protein